MWSPNEWNRFSYSFYGEEPHTVSIFAHCQNEYTSNEYLYLKSFDVKAYSNILSFLEGDGSDQSPYNYNHMIDYMESIGVKTYEVSNDGEGNTSLYVTSHSEYSFKVNGSDVVVNGDTLINLSQYGKNHIEVTKGEVILNIYY